MAQKRNQNSSYKLRTSLGNANSEYFSVLKQSERLTFLYQNISQKKARDEDEGHCLPTSPAQSNVPPGAGAVQSNGRRYSLQVSNCPASVNYRLKCSWQEHVGRKHPPKCRHHVKGAKKDLKIPVCMPGPRTALEKAQERPYALEKARETIRLRPSLALVKHPSAMPTS